MLSHQGGSQLAHETKANDRTLRRQADRFDAEGMVSLFRPTQHETTDEHRSLLPPIRQAQVDLSAEYADFSIRELAQSIALEAPATAQASGAG